MKELTLSKRIKAVKLFLNGYTYDEIADRIGIAKGSVVNIVDEFRDGTLAPPPDMAGIRWTPLLGQDRGYVKIGPHYPQGV